MDTAIPAARPDGRTLLAFAAVVLLGGLNALGVRETVTELAPFWGATIRFTLAGLVLLAIVLVGGRRRPSGRSLWGAVLYGVIGFAASYGLLYTAIRAVPVGTVTVLIALTPLLTFVLAVAHRQERFQVRGLLGGLIALAGIALVFADQLGASVPVFELVLVLGGVVCIAESAVILKWIPRSDPFATNAVAMLTGAAILGALSVAAGEVWDVPVRAETWVAIGYLVLLGSVALFSLFLFVVQRWTASAVSYSTLLFPFVGVSAATLIYHERLSVALVTGALIALVGVYVGAFGARPHRSSATSAPECLPIDNCADAVPRTAPAIR